MNINYKQPQFELFPANSATLDDTKKPPLLLASLTLSMESLVILVILGIMIALFSFSLGVERGRILAAQSLDEKVSAAWNVGGRRLAVVPNVPQAGKTEAVINNPVKASGNGGVFHSAPSKAAPVAAASVPAAASNRWTLQLATYRSENYAQQEALGLKAKGLPVFLIKSKDFYLVCVGRFDSQTQADSFSKKIQAKHSQARRF